MRRWTWLAATGILAGASILLGVSVWSPRVQAMRVADRFWQSVCAGDRAAVAAMLTADSDLQPDLLIEANRPCQHSAAFQVKDAPVASSGARAEYLVLSNLQRPATGDLVEQQVVLRREPNGWLVSKAGQHITY